MQTFPEVWRIFAEFGYFLCEFGDSFLFLCGNPGPLFSVVLCVPNRYSTCI